LEKKDDPAYPAYAALYEQVRQIPAFLTKIANELDSLDHIEKARRQLRDRAVDVRLGAALLEAVIPLVEASGERASIQKLQDSAMARADALDDMANQLPPSPIPRGFFPVRTTEQAQCFWAREEGGYLTGALITAKDDRGAIGVSVLEDYLWPVRFAFNSVVSASETGDTVEKNVDRLLAGGGNAVLNLGLPVFGMSTSPISCPGPQPAGASTTVPAVRRRAAQFSSEVLLAPRLGLDLPALGTAKEDPDVNLDLGVDARVSFQGALDVLSAFAQLRFARVFGSDEFYRGLSLDPEDGPFGYGQATMGVVLQRKVVLSYSLPVYAPPEIKPLFKGILSIALTR